MTGRLLTLACLIATGALLAFSTILAKLASGVGLSPVALLAWSCLGAAFLLLCTSAARGHLPQLNAQTIEYAFVAALVSFAAPNLLFYSAIPHVGVSFVALAIAFPPLFTYLGAFALRIERSSALRAGGVALALAGASYIALLKLSAPSGATGWIFAVLVGPVLLAMGNLYRTLRWPKGAQPDALAAIMLAAASVMLLSVGLLPGVTLAVPATGSAALLIGVQILTFTAQFAIFFVLQKRGGPVYISLLGSVAATLGVPFAILILGEAAPAGLLIGGLLIAAGIALVTSGTERIVTAQDVVAFWRAAGPEQWFAKSDTFDRQIRDHFKPTYQRAAAGALDTWRSSSEGALALILLLDQFPRNMFRGSGKAFAADHIARTVAGAAIDAGQDRDVDLALQPFFYLPFEHAEDAIDQDRAVTQMQSLVGRGGDAGSLKWAIEHRDIIKRFGRFPHRNILLGRQSTAEEQEFIAGGGFAG